VKRHQRWIEAETVHVTALEISATRGGRGREVDGRHLGPKKQVALHGTLAGVVLAPPKFYFACESGERSSGGATGVSEARWFRGRVADNATREPDPTRRSRSLRREAHGLPVSIFQGARPGERARRKPRRDAGNTRGVSARSRSSGKQKSVGTHRARAPSQRRKACGRGRASLSQSVGSADADGGSSTP
jgi:hypothetical protein